MKIRGKNSPWTLIENGISVFCIDFVFGQNAALFLLFDRFYHQVTHYVKKSEAANLKKEKQNGEKSSPKIERRKFTELGGHFSGFCSTLSSTRVDISRKFSGNSVSSLDEQSKFVNFKREKSWRKTENFLFARLEKQFFIRTVRQFENFVSTQV